MFLFLFFWSRDCQSCCAWFWGQWGHTMTTARMVTTCPQLNCHCSVLLLRTSLRATPISPWSSNLALKIIASSNPESTFPFTVLFSCRLLSPLDSIQLLFSMQIHPTYIYIYIDTPCWLYPSSRSFSGNTRKLKQECTQDLICYTGQFRGLYDHKRTFPSFPDFPLSRFGEKLENLAHCFSGFLLTFPYPDRTHSHSINSTTLKCVYCTYIICITAQP